MNDPRRLLRRWLREQGEQRVTPRDYAYGSPYDFVLKHGEWFDVQQVSSMPVGYCYANSIFIASLHDWIYVEGYAMTPYYDQVVQHAWVERPDGVPIDLSWRLPGQAYLGVRFSIPRAHYATWDGDANVLNDDNQGYPLLREPWAGETTWDDPMPDLVRAHAISMRLWRMPTPDGLPPTPQPTAADRAEKAWAEEQLARADVDAALVSSKVRP